MTGNEVTPNYYDKAVFLRVSGFVQQTDQHGRGPATPVSLAFTIPLGTKQHLMFYI
jgi:hypothetical protein